MKNKATLLILSMVVINAFTAFAKTTDRTKDQWIQLGSKKPLPTRKVTATYDVAVIGGGLAGISAAVSAARNGAKVVLIQDRPVLGGNASSEIRVTVNGVQGLKNKFKVERETGIVEEILIENKYYNPQESYSVWDHIVYDYVTREPNITLMLNTQAIEAVKKGNSIKSAICWQSTTETQYTINAKYFIDCSGDGMLAASAGALYRTGREGKEEFGESFAPDKADGWQMGASIMMITKDLGKPVKFIAPKFALKYDAAIANDRKIKQLKEGYWWIELGSEFDIVGDQEINRHKLLGYMYGVWDYIKNSGDFPQAENIALDWVGSVPGRRESRRFIGDYVLNQKDLEEYRDFPDAVAYGGWSLDEHCPGGIENLKERPSYFHAHFSQPYQIPFRSLYSKNIDNLMFAGRNISQTHIALSSSRIIATTALEGQAVGTASALCLKKGIMPRALATNNINELQEQLLRDDVYIPNRPAKDENNLAKKASVIFASSTKSGDVKLLTDGYSRDELDKIHHWESDGLNAIVQLEWLKAIDLSSVEIKANTDLQRQIMMHKNPEKNINQVPGVPPELLKNLIVEARVNGAWVEVGRVNNNITRLIKMKFPTVKASAVRIKLIDTWGYENVKLFEVRCY